MNVPHAYPNPMPPESPERAVWREPERLTSFRRTVEGRSPSTPDTHWVTWSSITAAPGSAPTRAAKAVTDCGIAVAGTMNDPHGANGMLMPPGTPITCDGCLAAQGADVFPGLERHLQQQRLLQAWPPVVEGRAA